MVLERIVAGLAVAAVLCASLAVFFGGLYIASRGPR